MTTQYADQQPDGFKNFVENIAVVGAGGLVGGYITRELIAQGKHKVAALTRPDSTGPLPEGLTSIKKANYDDQSALVSALQDQDVLIITLNVRAPRDSQQKLIDAAIEAGVKYIMPNEYGGDIPDEGFANDTRHGAASLVTRRYIEEKAEGTHTNWVSLACGFWYDYSLSGTEARYGFDFEKKSVTFFGEGKVKTSTSTFPQCARAVARLFALPILPSSQTDNSSALSHWNNKPLFISSFTLSQRDMFASVLRVTGDKESDWTITYEDHEVRYKRGVEMFEQGNLVGFGILLYTRVFYPGEPGNFEAKLQNKLLDLPEEDLDHWTKVAVETAEHGIGK